MDTAAAVNALLRAGKAQATRNILATAAETRVAAVRTVISLDGKYSHITYTQWFAVCTIG